MFSGTVVHGEKIGRTLGYPTANLDIPTKNIKLSSGIYAAEVTLYKTKYPAALIINDVREKVEVYFFNYEGKEFYGVEITVDPIQKVSEIEPFENFEELKKKIQHDIELVKKLLKI